MKQHCQEGDLRIEFKNCTLSKSESRRVRQGLANRSLPHNGTFTIGQRNLKAAKIKGGVVVTNA